MKLALIGCTPAAVFLAKGIAQVAKDLDIERLTICSADKEALSAFGVLAQKTASLLDQKLTVRTVDNRVEALMGADVVLADLSAPSAREEERISAAVLGRGLVDRHGLGARGFAEALRLTPSFVKLCDLTARYGAPGAVLLNLTVPCGVLVHAARAAGFDFVFGAPVRYEMMSFLAAAVLRREPQTLVFRGAGSAELGALIAAEDGDGDLLPSVLRSEALFKNAAYKFLPPMLLRRRGCLLSADWGPYLCWERCLSRAGPENAVPVRLARAQADCAAKLLLLDIDNEYREALQVYRGFLYQAANLGAALGEGRGGTEFDPFTLASAPRARAVLTLLEALAGEKEKNVPLIAPGDGVCAQLPPWAAVLCTCAVSKRGIRPVGAETPDEDSLEEIRRQTYYERRLGSALTHEDLGAAAEALAMHTLVRSFSIASALTAELAAMKLTDDG